MDKQKIEQIMDYIYNQIKQMNPEINESNRNQHIFIEEEGTNDCIHSDGFHELYIFSTRIEFDEYETYIAYTLLEKGIKKREEIVLNITTNYTIENLSENWSGEYKDEKELDKQVKLAFNKDYRSFIEKYQNLIKDLKKPIKIANLGSINLSNIFFSDESDMERIKIK